MEDCLHTSSDNLSKLVKWAHSHGTICTLIPNLKHLLTEGAHGNLTALWGCSAGHAYHWPLAATCKTGPKERICYPDSRSITADNLLAQGASAGQRGRERFLDRSSGKTKAESAQAGDSCDFSNCSEPSEADDNGEEFNSNLFDIVCESSATDEDGDSEPQRQSQTQHPQPPLQAQTHHAALLRKRPITGTGVADTGGDGEHTLKKIKQESSAEDYYTVADAQLAGGSEGSAGPASTVVSQSPRPSSQTRPSSRSSSSLTHKPSSLDGDSLGVISPADASSPHPQTLGRGPQAHHAHGTGSGGSARGAGSMAHLPAKSEAQGRMAGEEQMAKSSGGFGDLGLGMNPELDLMAGHGLNADSRADASEMERKGKTGKNSRDGKKLKVKVNQWTEESMEGAIREFQELVTAGLKPGLRVIARAWDVPRSTLERRVKGKIPGSKYASGRKPYLSQEAEAELAGVIKMLSRRGFPVTKKEIQNLAFSYAKVNGIKGFSDARGSAGYHWFNNFIRRHKDVSVKKTKPLSATRAAVLNPEVVSQWFSMYESLLQELGIVDIPSHIWSCDESGLQDAFCSGRVLGEVEKQCVEITAEEKGETTTVLVAFNAAGTFAPTHIVFKGKTVSAEWSYGCPRNMVASVSDDGGITRELFLEWGKMFVGQLPERDSRPHVLLLDGRRSHLYNIPFLDLMKKHNVHVLCYPAHAAHTLQSTHTAFFKCLKCIWHEEGRQWMRERADQRLPKMEFFALFRKVWERIATAEAAQAGFRSTEMYPLCKDLIPAENVGPSLTTERTMLLSAPSPSYDGPSCPLTHLSDVSVHQCAGHSSPTHLSNVLPYLALSPSPGLDHLSNMAAHSPDIPSPPTSPSNTPAQDMYLDNVGAEQMAMAAVDEDASFFSSTPKHDGLAHPTPEDLDVQPSTTEAVCLMGMESVPRREKRVQKRSSPSDLLTSEQHLEVIDAHHEPAGSRPEAQGDEKVAPTSAVFPCSICGSVYGDNGDPKAEEEWIGCQGCMKWFHESCGEAHGVIDDEGFVCKDCILA